MTNQTGLLKSCSEDILKQHLVGVVGAETSKKLLNVAKKAIECAVSAHIYKDDSFNNVRLKMPGAFPQEAVSVADVIERLNLSGFVEYQVELELLHCA